MQTCVFSYPDIKGEPLESEHSVLSPYLFDASDLKNPKINVREVSQPMNGLSQMIIGSQPIDGGHYIFNEKSRNEFLEMEPGATQFMRPYIGAREFLNGKKRWILALHDVPPNILATLPYVRERITNVRNYRQVSKRVSTIKLSKTPTLYQVNTLPHNPFLVIPRISSQRREYIPIGWLHPPAIPSDQVLVLKNASLIDFALLTSSMHMAWMRYIAGRLGNGYRYSVGVVYNTFPLPPQPCDLDSLTPLAQAILNIRDDYKDATLAQLYDPDLMPPDLRSAHQKLDIAVDKLYHREGFDSEQDRIQYLFRLYEKMISPIE